MKKRVIALFLVAATALSLAGCGKFTCDLCGEEKSGKKYTTELLGQKLTYCKDCKDEISSWFGK